MKIRDLADRRGVLRTPAGGAWALDRRLPSAALAPYVAWYWSVDWDLTGHPPHRQVTVGHVSAHLVVERGVAELHGVPRHRFERVLAGAGRVVGVRFTAGGLAALRGRPLVGGPVPAAIPGLDAEGLAAGVTRAAGLDAAVAVLEPHLRAVAPPAPAPATLLVERAVRLVQEDRGVLRVADLAERAGVGVRVLQRHFAVHVGVSPGWVIRRCRLQEAAHRATAGGRVDWAGLAADLCYSDQAHLVRDFTATMGVPPARYVSGRP